MKVSIDGMAESTLRQVADLVSGAEIRDICVTHDYIKGDDVPKMDGCLMQEYDYGLCKTRTFLIIPVERET